MKLVFFSRPKPKQFDYKPIYYDKEKDEREQRKKELGITDSEDHLDQLRARLSRKWRYERNQDKKRYSEIRTIIYLLVVAMAVYLIFFTDFIRNFVTFFTR